MWNKLKSNHAYRAQVIYSSQPSELTLVEAAVLNFFFLVVADFLFFYNLSKLIVLFQSELFSLKAWYEIEIS